MDTNFNRRLDLCRKNMLLAVFSFEQIRETTNHINHTDKIVSEHIHDNLFLSRSKITKANTQIEGLLNDLNKAAKSHDQSK